LPAKRCPDCESEDFYQDGEGNWRCKKCNKKVDLVAPRAARRPGSLRRRKPGKTTKTKKIAKNLVEFKTSRPLTSIVVYCNRCHEELIKLSDHSNADMRRLKNKWKQHECRKQRQEYYT